MAGVVGPTQEWSVGGTEDALVGEVLELLLDVCSLGQLVGVEGGGTQLESFKQQSRLLEEVGCSWRDVGSVEDVAELVGEFAAGEEEVVPYAEMDL